MKKSGNGKGAFGRSRCARPARRRLSVNENVAIGASLIVAVALTMWFFSVSTGATVGAIGAVVWIGVLFYRAQRRSLQRS